MKTIMRTNTIHNFAKRLVMVLVVGLITANAWGTTTYKLTQITSSSNLVEGKYVFEEEEGTHVLLGSVSDKTLQYTTTYSTTGLSGTESYVWTLEESEDGWYLKNQSGNYMRHKASSAEISFSDVNQSNNEWTIPFYTDGTVSVRSYSENTRYLGSGTYMYRAYTSGLVYFNLYILEEECSNSVTISKGTQTNCTFTLSKSGSQASCDGVSTTVTVSPSTGYDSPSVTQSGASAAPTISGSSNTWTVAYGANTTGTSTINVSCSAKTYTVTLNDNGGSGGSESKTVTYNANTNMTTAVAKPTRTHYDFGGYWTSSDAGTTLTTQIIDENGAWKKSVTGYTDATPNWVNDGGVTLYAKWTEHSVTNYRTICSTTYDITLDDGEVATTYNGSAKVAASGTQLTNITAPTKTGYKIDGYYADDKSTLVAEADGTLKKSVTISSTPWTNSDGEWVLGDDATFYAKWEAISYSVHFNSNDENYLGTAEGSMSDQDFEYGTAQNLTTNAFSLAGYDFAGWATTADGSVAHTDGKSVSNLSTTDEDVVDLYAIWTAKKYTLTLANTNETSSVGSQTVQATYGSDMPLVTTADGTPDVAALSRTGYTFDGWEYSSTQYYSYDAGEDEISSAHIWDVASTATLTPRWNINSYTLTWNLDGGTVTEAGTGAAVDATGTPNSEVEYNAAISVPTVTKAGYTFAGWSSTPADNMPASNTTYTATWTALHDKYYDRMHETGSLTDASGYKYTDKSGAGYSVPSCADKDGETGNIQCEKDHYKFLGWLESTYINDDGSLKDGATSHLIPASGTTDATGKTYYAIWGEE